MIRRVCASLTLVSMLAACGGGGGGSSAVPSAPTSPQSAKATFAFRIPGKGTMARIRRPAYVSQATAGVAIDWISTNPRTPDFAAPVSATCPATLPAGVTACSTDAAGNTDYTLQLEIPAGTYTFTVTGFDAAPSSGAFPSGNVLSQGQLAAPVTITAGIANTVQSFTFYGVPASVSLTGAPGESHVTTFNSVLSVIGSAPQTVFVQALDADGFAIGSSDSGAPSLTLQESASDSPQHFTIATTANKYAFTLTAKDASAVANLTATATAGGSGLGSSQSTYSVMPVQELWAMEGVTGIAGYALYPPNYNASAAIDLSNPSTLACSPSCNWQWAALAPDGTLWVNDTSAHGLYAFAQASGSPGLTAPAGPSAIPLGTSTQAFTIDGNGLIYIPDDTSTPGTISIYDTKAPSATALATITDTASNEPYSVAIAPNAPNVPTALVGSIWVADTATPIGVYAKYTSGVPSGPVAPAGPPTGAYALAFDASGNLWVDDNKANDIDVYTIGGTPASPTLTLVAQVSAITWNQQIGITAQQTGWMGGAPASYTSIYGFTLSGTSLTNASNQGSINASVSGIVIAP